MRNRKDYDYYIFLDYSEGWMDIILSSRKRLVNYYPRFQNSNTIKIEDIEKYI